MLPRRMDFKLTGCLICISTIWNAVLGAQNGPNFINCPLTSRVIEWEVESENANTPIEYGVTPNVKLLLAGLILRTDVNSEISYEPPSGTYFANKSSVGRSFLVEATATNEANSTTTCRFLIHVTAHCKPWTLKSPRNGLKTCNKSSSGWTCWFSCLPGHVFYKEAWPVNLTCVDGQAGWTPARSIPNCAVYERANFSLVVGFTYNPAVGSAINETLCENSYLAAFRKALRHVSRGLTDQCRTQLDTASPGRYVELHEQFLQMHIQRNQVSINITVFIRPNNLSDAELTSCGGLSHFQLIGVTLYKSIKPLETVTPSTSECPTLRTTLAGVIQRQPLFQCHNKLEALIQRKNDNICLSCPSGYITNDNGNACEPCAKGYYQSAGGQEECAMCPNGTWTRHEASTSAAECQDVCPRGFFSRKGLPPCKRCPVDTYSASPSLCSDCPNGKSTVGIDGAIDVSACIVSCPSGYITNDNGNACEPCAKGYYQSADRQEECARCPNGTWTRNEASTSAAECQDVCPRGFFSRTGLPPCKRCPVDTYSASPSLCFDCPNGKSTVGIDGAIDVSACIDCGDITCRNGGKCVAFGDVIRCVCTAAYTGRTCEKPATVTRSCAGDKRTKCAALPISYVKVTSP